MTKQYGYDLQAQHSAAIFEVGSEADPKVNNDSGTLPSTPGTVVGTSEWVWLSEENAKRICAALTLTSKLTLSELENMSQTPIESEKNS